MPKRIIDTNPHLRDPKKREESIIQSIIGSSRIEGIIISPEKAREMYREAQKRIKKIK
jgi:hypothetical protein